jgi:hypothetical protein
MKRFFKWLLVLLPLLVIAPTIPSDETGVAVALCSLYAFFVFVIWVVIRLKKRYTLTPEEVARRDELRESVEQQKREAAKPAACPRCYSTSITANEKGFGVGKAVVGVGLFGLPGILAGSIGRKKIKVTCLSCGHSWWVR